jgi:phosphohistidine phosphatase
MNLYLVRHGAADWPHWDKSDDERPLTEEGKQEVGRVAKLLKSLEVEGTVLSSPLPRAAQTAKIVAKALGEEVREVDELRPGPSRSDFAELLLRFAGKHLMLVGHEPDFTRLISRLTGAKTKLTKAGVALIKFDRDKEEGELRWLVPPRFAGN